MSKEMGRDEMHDMNNRACDLIRAGDTRGLNILRNSHLGAPLTLQGEDFRKAQIPGAILSRANLEMTNFEEADLSGAFCIRTTFRNAVLRAANLKNANFQETNLQGADLSGANLLNTNLRGANLDNVTIDDGEGATYILRSVA